MDEGGVEGPGRRAGGGRGGCWGVMEGVLVRLEGGRERGRLAGSGEERSGGEGGGLVEGWGMGPGGRGDGEGAGADFIVQQRAGLAK